MLVNGAKVDVTDGNLASIVMSDPSTVIMLPTPNWIPKRPVLTPNDSRERTANLEYATSSPRVL